MTSLNALTGISCTCLSLLVRCSLNVLSWDDPLLSAVLKGQNISGVRQVKGRRTETLNETVVVVRTRVLKLQQQNRLEVIMLSWLC